MLMEDLMRKILWLLIFALLITACSGKNYDLSSKPQVIFKTTLGDFTIRFYKNAAPNSVDVFLKSCKEKKYKGYAIDLISLEDFVIGVGFQKIFEGDISKDISKEVVSEKKKIMKNEVYFRVDEKDAKVKTLGKTFFIYNQPTAITDDAKRLIVFGKVVNSEDFLSQVMNVRTDVLEAPSEKIEILDVEVVE